MVAGNHGGYPYVLGFEGEVAFAGADPCVWPKYWKQSHLSIKRDFKNCDFSGDRLILINSATNKLTDHGILGHDAVIFERVNLLE